MGGCGSCGDSAADVPPWAKEMLPEDAKKHRESYRLATRIARSLPTRSCARPPCAALCRRRTSRWADVGSLLFRNAERFMRQRGTVTGTTIANMLKKDKKPKQKKVADGKRRAGGTNGELGQSLTQQGSATMEVVEDFPEPEPESFTGGGSGSDPGGPAAPWGLFRELTEVEAQAVLKLGWSKRTWEAGVRNVAAFLKHFDELTPVRYLTTWTALQHDGPNHLGLRCNAHPGAARP